MVRKYPFDYHLKNHFWLAIGLFLWLFVFLWFTKPFQLEDLEINQQLSVSLSYSFFGSLTYLLSLIVQHFLLKSSKKWTILDEVLFAISLAIIGFIFIFLFYKNVLFSSKIGTTPYQFALNVFLPAIYTVLPLIIISRWFLGYLYDKKLSKLKITIQGEGRNEFLKIFFEELIIVKSDDNYVEIIYLESDTIKAQIIRNKLSIIQNQFPNLLKTHRSYLINPYHFKRFKSSNNKLVIILTNDIEVPVSRNLQSEIKVQLQPTTK
jgi:heme/copper-type cytochrome/quinol oxidase subunit 2